MRFEVLSPPFDVETFAYYDVQVASAERPTLRPERLASRRSLLQRLSEQKAPSPLVLLPPKRVSALPLAQRVPLHLPPAPHRITGSSPPEVDASLDGQRYFGTPLKFTVYDLQITGLSPNCGPLDRTRGFRAVKGILAGERFAHGDPSISSPHISRSRRC